MSEGKKNLIAELIEMYDIKSAKDIEDALKDLLGWTIQEMLESEMDEHLGYQEYERSDNSNYRNGKKTKKMYIPLRAAVAVGAVYTEDTWKFGRNRDRSAPGS